jgi:alcohol dehydrogenase, propanol-preferring
MAAIFIMRAMVLDAPKQPLQLRNVPKPRPAAGEILLRVSTCAVCRTDLHIVDGELPEPKLPLVPGHEVVGRVEEIGRDVKEFREGDRVGIPWLGWTCGECKFCRSGRENLCDRARFTGYNLDGGYAEFVVADARFCFPIPDGFEDVAAAPLLCAGLIGFRALRKCGDPKRLGLYGFGAAAHIICQVARFEGRKVFAFTRPGDIETQKFAQRLGATWIGGSDQPPPEKMDAAIIFAPVGALMPVALRHLEKGGMVISAGIHMSDIPAFPYHDLWGERALCSVANLTRRDGQEFFEIAPRIPVKTETETFPLEQANEALTRLRDGQLEGAAVLIMK